MLPAVPAVSAVPGTRDPRQEYGLTRSGPWRSKGNLDLVATLDGVRGIQANRDPVADKGDRQADKFLATHRNARDRSTSP